LPELLFRYRARNFPQTLSAIEQQQWQAFCRQRLLHEELGAPNTLAAFLAAEKALQDDSAVLREWHEYALQLSVQLDLGVPDNDI
jgi:exodeoxyribonuclease I